MLLEFVVVSDGHGPQPNQAEKSVCPSSPLGRCLLGPQHLHSRCWPLPVAIGGVGRQLPHVACSRGLRWECFPEGATPTLGSPGWWGWGGTNPLGAAVKTALPLLPARCFEVGPRAWLCRAAPRPVIRHVRSRLHLLITARSAGTLASPQTTFPSPQGREAWQLSWPYF